MARKVAKSDQVPGNPLADYLQAFRFNHQLPDNGGTGTTVKATGMRRPISFVSPDPKNPIIVEAWEVHAVTVRPAIGQDAPGPMPTAAAKWMHMQLLYEQQTGLLPEADEDYDDLIAGATVYYGREGDSGGWAFSWPVGLDVVNPRPVFGEYVTFATDHVDDSHFNEANLTVTIWYAPILLQAGVVDLMLAARARL